MKLLEEKITFSIDLQLVYICLNLSFLFHIMKPKQGSYLLADAKLSVMSCYCNCQHPIRPECFILTPLLFFVHFKLKKTYERNRI